MDIIKIRALNLEAYLKPGTKNQWLLPVCADNPAMNDRLARLNRNNPGNWENTEIDGVPTVCYRMTGRQIKTWNKLSFRKVWPQFADRLGKAVAKEFYYPMWVTANNLAVRARNKWEEHHGGIKGDRFNRGMSLRSAAPMSIT